MKKFTIYIVFMAACHIALAQANFAVRYSNNFPFMSVTSNGDYLLNEYQGFGTISLYRIDPAGNTLWAREFYLAPWSMVKASEGASGDIFIPVNWTDSSTMTPYGAIIKLNAAGNVQWTKYVQDTSASGGVRFLIRTSDNYNVFSYINSANEVIIIKFDDNGNLIWTKAYWGLMFNRALAVENGAFLGSYAQGLYKINAAGDTLWTKLLNENGSFVSLYDLKLLPDGGYLLGGESHYNGNHGLLIKMDTGGNIIWSRNYIFPDTIVSIYPLIAVPESDIFMVMRRGGFAETIFLKTDSSGIPLWSKKVGLYNFLGHDMQATSDGGFIFTGQIVSPPMLHHGLVLKTDSAGTALNCYSPYSVTSVPASVTATSGYTQVFTASYPFVNTHIYSTPAVVYSDNGCFPTGLEETAGSKVNVFPNPVNDVIHVSGLQNSGNYLFEVFSVTGQNILSQQIVVKGNPDVPLKITSLPDAVYVLKISGEKANLQTRFVKYRE